MPPRKDVSAFGDTDGEFFGRKKIRPNIFWQKNFFDRKKVSARKKIGRKKKKKKKKKKNEFFSAENFSAENIPCSRNVFGRKFFVQFFFGRNIFGRKIFGRKTIGRNFFVRKIFRPKISPFVSPKAETMGGPGGVGAPPRSVRPSIREVWAEPTLQRRRESIPGSKPPLPPLCPHFDYSNGILYLRMRGSCSGSANSDTTLHEGLKKLMFHYLPEVKQIVSLRDEEHDPLFQESLEQSW